MNNKYKLKLYVIMLYLWLACNSSLCSHYDFEKEYLYPKIFIENASDKIIVVCCNRQYDDENNHLINNSLKLSTQIGTVNVGEIAKIKALDTFESLEKDGVKFQILIFKKENFDAFLNSDDKSVLYIDKRYILGYDDLVDNAFYIKYTGE